MGFLHVQHDFHTAAVRGGRVVFIAGSEKSSQAVRCLRFQMLGNANAWRSLAFANCAARVGVGCGWEVSHAPRSIALLGAASSLSLLVHLCARGMDMGQGTRGIVRVLLPSHLIFLFTVAFHVVNLPLCLRFWHA